MSLNGYNEISKKLRAERRSELQTELNAVNSKLMEIDALENKKKQGSHISVDTTKSRSDKYRVFSDTPESPKSASSSDENSPSVSPRGDNFGNVFSVGDSVVIKCKSRPKTLANAQQSPGKSSNSEPALLHSFKVSRLQI